MRRYAARVGQIETEGVHSPSACRQTPHGYSAAGRTNIPQRRDRLPWSRWHSKMVIALGIKWLLDGLEVTLAGSLASMLKTNTRSA